MNTKKTLVAVIAAMLVAATLPCFAKGKVVTQWKTKSGDETASLTFYSDKTADLITIDKYGDSHEEGTFSYSGDTTKDGKISIVGNDDASIVIVGDLMILGDIVFTKVK